MPHPTSPSPQRPLPRRGLGPAALEAALDSGCLEVVYQPVVDLRSGLAVAAEALARLRDPSTGTLLPPAAFIPTAEECGLVSRIDARVAEVAVTQAAQWRSRLGERAFSIGINLSVADLDDAALPSTLQALCTSTGLPLDALVVEVTETLLSVEGHGHEDVLRTLAALGVNVTMDDFGTGFSSLSYLRRFPVAGIKVDRVFTRDLDVEPTLTRALVRFGLELGVHVVAEGVETATQLATLIDVGCPFAQGYLLSPPVSAEQLEPLLHRVFPLPTAHVPQPRGNRVDTRR